MSALAGRRQQERQGGDAVAACKPQAAEGGIAGLRSGAVAAGGARHEPDAIDNCLCAP